MYNKKKLEGFSLLELLISVAIFSVVILSVTIIFSSTLRAYYYSRNVQENLENAQYALNYMSKIIREGEIHSHPSSTQIIISSSVACYEFTHDNVNKTMTRRIGNATCANWSGPSVAVSNVGNLKFITQEKIIDPINPASNQAGLVTILMSLCTDDSCSRPDKVNIQTSVSLRNLFET